MTTTARPAELESVLAAIRACRRCVEAPQASPCRMSRARCCASSTARLAVCSQAPGTKVHASGMPFTDRSGDRLRDWMGVTPQEFYDESRSPSCRWVSAFRDRTRRAPICRRGANARGMARAIVRGAAAARARAGGRLLRANFHLGAAAESTAGDRAGLARRSEAQGRPRVLPLPHPSWRNNAWLKDNPWFEAELLPALRREVRRPL